MTLAEVRKLKEWAKKFLTKNLKAEKRIKKVVDGRKRSDNLKEHQTRTRNEKRNPKKDLTKRKSQCKIK